MNLESGKLVHNHIILPLLVSCSVNLYLYVALSTFTGRLDATFSRPRAKRKESGGN